MLPQYSPWTDYARDQTIVFCLAFHEGFGVIWSDPQELLDNFLVCCWMRMNIGIWTPIELKVFTHVGIVFCCLSVL